MYDEILSSIDNIDDCVMEAEMNVLTAMINEYDKALMIYENYNGDDCSSFDIFMEASSGGTEKKSLGSKVKSFFVKIWGMIKKFFSLIGKGLMRLINFIKGFFSKTKNPGTADQCIEEAGVNNNSSDVFTEQKTMTDHNKIVETINISFENSKGKVIDTKINVMSKKTFLSFINKDELVVDFNKAYINNLINMLTAGKANNVQKIKGLGPTNDFNIYNLCVALNDKCYFTRFEKVITLISDVISGNKKVKPDKFQEVLEKQLNFHNDNFRGMSILDMFIPINPSDINKYRISLKGLMNLSKRVNKITEQMNIFTSDKVFDNPIFENDYMTTLMNNMHVYISSIQMGINALSNAIKQSYIIDRKFVGAIKNIETLSKFTKSMVDHGIPSKYVAYNVYLASDKNIVGQDEYKPKMGQSRLVFFPINKSDSVYKIALSGWGMNSNTNEKRLYEKVKGTNIGKYFIPAKYITKNGYVIEMQKADTSRKPPVDQCTNIALEINNILNKTNIRMSVNDIHANNVAYYSKSSNDLVIIDYGDVAVRGKSYIF